MKWGLAFGENRDDQRKQPAVCWWTREVKGGKKKKKRAGGNRMLLDRKDEQVCRVNKSNDLSVYPLPIMGDWEEMESVL